MTAPPVHGVDPATGGPLDRSGVAVADSCLAGAAMLAIVPVRGGTLPAGAAETVAEAGGAALVVGGGAAQAAALLGGPGPVAFAELGDYAPAAWAGALLDITRDHRVLVLPGSADGRDLAPRLAHASGRTLLTGAISVDAEHAVLARRGGLVAETHRITAPVVATLLPGVRGVPDGPAAGPPPIRLDLDRGAGADVVVLEVLDADPATMDLAEATRVVAGGAGLGSAERFETLAAVAAGLGATPGATRVVADAGWVSQHRYIGTTGVSIDPDLYIAVGVSGAVQHITGIGHPDHIVAVNTDPSAPMMGMADLAIVTDGRAVLDILAARFAGGAEASLGAVPDRPALVEGPARPDGPALLDAMAESTARVLATAGALDDGDVAHPSTLPGWNRAMVLTHLARNADAFRSIVEGALAGEVAPMYTHGREGRDADIEAGRIRSAAEVVDDLHGAAAGLAGAFAALTPEQWDGLGVGPRGTVRVTSVPARRMREVEIHHVDLGLAYGPEQWPADWVAAELDEAVEDLPERLAGAMLRLVATDTGWTWESTGAQGDPDGEVPGRAQVEAPAAPPLAQGAAQVEAPAAQLLAWLLGRPSSVEDGPILGAW